MTSLSFQDKESKHCGAATALCVHAHYTLLLMCFPARDRSQPEERENKWAGTVPELEPDLILRHFETYSFPGSLMSHLFL